MGNKDILANFSPDQFNQALKSVYGAGTGQATGANALANLMANQPQQQSSNSLSGWLVDNFKKMFGGQSSPEQWPPQQQMPSNPFAQQPNLSAQDRNAMANMQPGDSYVIPRNQGSPTQGAGENSGYSYDQNGNNVVASPQEISAAANRSQYSAQNTPSENAANYEGTKSEGIERGKVRAKQMEELSNTVFDARTKQQTLDNAIKIISSPAFEEVRQTPILGNKEIAYFKRYGTPEQQNMLGQLTTLNGTIIKDSSRDFSGQFRKGEQELLSQTKINDNDTFNVMRGKMEQLSFLNQMLEKRASLTNQVMGQYHMDKLQAENIADKQINGDALRQHIHNTLNPMPTDEDIRFMAEKYKTTAEEIIKRLKAKGIG